MNKRRLLKLADLLEADAANERGMKFDLLRWGSVKDDKDVISCGTTGCAAGLAAMSGAFKDEGLSYRLTAPHRYSDGTFSTPHINITINDEFPDDPKWDGSFISITRFFGLSTTEGTLLFMASEYPSDRRAGVAGELAVAARIRDFVAGKASR